MLFCLTYASDKVVLKDTVEYHHLTIGKFYDVTGTLMVKSTNSPLLDANGEPVTATARFRAEVTDGTIELTFEFDARALAGDAVVAFETLYRNNTAVALHTDINDEDQTVHFPEIDTTATGEDTSDHDAPAKEMTTIFLTQSMALNDPPVPPYM